MTLQRTRSGMSTCVPFNDLAVQWHEIKDDVLPGMLSVFESGAFSHGPEVEAFERAIANYLGTAHVIAVNSGTSAVHLAMLAAGIGPGSEVIVPAHTFIATAWGVIYAGAKLVLCDVEESSGNIDVAHAEELVTPRTRAIVPVHLYGQPANMDAVTRLAERYGLTVIEDAAQAIGSRWNGSPAGTIGGLGCFSFYPGKNLGAAGEGGAVVAADSNVATRLRRLRNHGQTERYLHDEVGFNYRMDGLQGLVLRHKIMHLDRWTMRRRQLAEGYLHGLAAMKVSIPAVVHRDHVWHLFVIRTPLRDALRRHLTEAGIETGLHYPIPLHRQPCFASLGFAAMDYPETERWASEGLSLPLYYGMSDAQVNYVVSSVGDFFEKG